MRRQVHVPARQSPVIRQSGNDVKENDQWSEKAQSRPSRKADISSSSSQVRKERASDAQLIKVIAYVSRPPRCVHSEDLLELASELNVRVEIYDIDTITAPDWLPGTPTLETEHGQVYCGDAAFDWIRECAAQSGRDSGANRQYQENQLDQEHLTPEEKHREEAYSFLAQDTDHKPSSSGGGTLKEAFAESDRLFKAAETQEPELNAQAAFDKMMNARG